MADIIQIRRDTAANWTTADPVLAQGEFGWEIDTNVLKLGDGSTVYTLLPVFSGSITAQDDGTTVVQAMSFNFTGGGVTVTDVGGVATVNVPSAPSAPISSVFGRTGAVTAQSGDYSGAQVTYSGTASGLSASNVQSAIDEVEARVDTLESAPGAPVDSVFGRTGAVVAVAGDYNASQVAYNNASSGLSATNTQGAIDEIEARVDTLEGAPPPPVTSVFGRTGIVVAVAGDYNASQVTYNNASSGLTATNTQAAIDEVEARVDTLESAPGAPVDSVFGRTGAVTAQVGDYTAVQVSFDGTASGMPASNVQGAIDTLDVRVDALESTPAPVTSVFGRTGAIVAVSGDYDADQVDFDDSNTPITAADLQAALEAIAPRVAVFEAFNTNNTTNLNNFGLTTVPIIGNVTQPGPSGYFTVVGNTVRVNIPMRIKMSANVNIFSNQPRQNLRVGFAINGTLQNNFTARSGYIRDASGHQESSLHPSQFLDLAANDVVSVVCQREANGGTVTLIANASNLMIEVVELL